MTEFLFYAAGLNTLLAAAVALIAALATCASLRPAWTHWLWLAALLRLIMPPLWSLSLLPPWTALTTSDHTTLTASNAPHNFFSPASETQGNPSVATQSETCALTARTHASATESGPACETWSQVIALVWLGGALSWWSLAGSRLVRFQRQLCHAQSVPFSSNTVHNIPVRLVDSPVSPCLWAMGRACILFPRELYFALPTTERELILRHELAHYRRRDHWVRWVEFVVLGLHWWNPLAWWLVGRLRDAEETACDADVTHAAPQERRTYATALLRTVDFLAGRAQPTPHLASGISALPLLKRRVQKILDTANPPRRPAYAACVGLLAATVSTATPVPINPTETIPSSDSPPDDALASTSPEKPNSVTSSKNPLPSAQAALEAAKAFFAADTVDEKLRYVRFGEKMRPWMEAWYQTHDLRSESLIEDKLSLILTKKLSFGDQHYLVVAVQFARTDAYHFLAVEETLDGPKIDWETCVGWQPMTFAEFTKAPQPSPQLFRVHAAVGDSYNGLFAEDAVWQCVKLTYPGLEDFLLYGYARRDSEVGRQLAALLDGQSVSIIVSLSRPAGAEASQAVIERVVHKSWFLSDGPLSTP